MRKYVFIESREWVLDFGRLIKVAPSLRLASCPRIAFAESDLSLRASRHVELYKEILRRGSGRACR